MDMICRYFDYSMKGVSNVKVVELGGGNSCFAETFCEQNEVERYDIIDNNEYAVELFGKKKFMSRGRGYVLNLTQKIQPEEMYDFVYSIGLIEHFTVDEREKVLKNHFEYCKDGGFVLISFPTPTLKYRICRKFMELLHVWQFHDETPLLLEDIQNELNQYGSIILTDLNKKLFLTQRVVLVKKNGREENV